MKTVFRQQLLVYVAPALLLYAVTARALWRTPNSLFGMYANQDGMWAAWNTAGLLQWARLFDLSPFNPLSGTGSLFLPNLPWLNPAALILGSPLPEDLTYLISYTLYYAELFISSVVLFRVLGVSPIRSSLAAQLYLLLLFPPFPSVTDALTWFSLAPVNAHLVALAHLGLSLFLLLARGDTTRRNVCYALGVIATVFVGLLSAPITFLTYGPAYALIAGGFSLWQRDRATLVWRLGTIAVLACLLWGSGFVDYVRGSVGVSARTVGIPPAFAAGWELLTFQYWREASKQFDICNAAPANCYRDLIFKFYVAAILGAVTQVFRATAPLKTMAVLLLILVGAIEVSANVHNLSLFGIWHTLAPAYFVWSAHTFFALFATVLICAPGDLWAHVRSRLAGASFAGDLNFPQLTTGRFAATTVTALLVPACALYLWEVKIGPNQPRAGPDKRALALLGTSSIRQPTAGPIVSYLREHTRLAPRDPFRGYVATYLGDTRGHLRKAIGLNHAGPSADIFPQLNPYLDHHYGNRFQEMGLWRFNIPTAEEYGQWVTRTSYAFMNLLFDRERHRASPAFLRIYGIEHEWLAALGVRFLITDFGIDDQRFTLRVRQGSATAGPIYLHELAQPNIASYSPARTIKVKTFREAIEAFKSNATKLQENAIVFADLAGPFRKAHKVEMRMVRDGFRVTAESDGVSLILLPVQFSRCLQVTPVESSARPDEIRLFRANGIQTLLQFAHRVDVSVRFEFGLFGSALCRLEDAKDLARLDVPS